MDGLNFIEEMREAMEKVSEACKHNEEWINCYILCPFGDYCDAIERQGYPLPEEWRN